MNLTIERPPVKWPGCEIIADHADLTNDQWRDLRRSGIGGSDAGAIMGVSRYASPLTVWMDKTGRGEDFVGNEATAVGSILEPLIRDHIIHQYMSEQGCQVDEIGEAPHVYRSDMFPWMLANIDGYIITDGNRYGLEIKTGGSYQLSEWGGMEGDEIPDTYYAQVQHYMAVTDTAAWLVFGLIGNRRLHRWIPRNNGYITALVDAEHELWNRVQSSDPLHAPAPIGLSAEDAAIDRLTNPMTNEHADLSNIGDVVDRYYSLGKEIKDMETARKEAQQVIRQTMGTAASGETDHYRIKRTAYTREGFDASRYVKDHPEAMDGYTKQITVDFPRVSEKKERK
jgi:putative phage-type endonuclease